MVRMHIMKSILIILFVFITLLVQSQKPCRCDKDTTLKFNFLCGTTKLKNNATLYNQFDCDTLYMILVSSNGDKHKICRTGLIEAQNPHREPWLQMDFDSSVLICTYASGGGVSRSYSLFDKQNGKNIGNFFNIFHEDTTQNLIVYFTSADSLILNFIGNKKKYSVATPIPEERLMNTLTQVGCHPSNLIEESKINNNILTCKYRYQEKGVPDKWLYDYFIIDLKKYAH